MDWRRLDLNLLKVLATMLDERSVARTADRLCISPSAVSHALARLRRAFGDPLFVRSGASMIPTARAESMRRPIGNLIASLDAQMRDAAHGGAFDPARTSRALRLAVPGALELTLVPAIMARLRCTAPAWSLAVEPFERRSYEADLVSGRVDFVFAVGGHTPVAEMIGATVLWQDELVVVAGPLSDLFARQEPLDADAYLGQPQIYPLPWPRTQNFLDIELGRLGCHRHLALHLPGYAGVGAMLRHTDLIASMPDRTAAAIIRSFPDLRLLRLLPARRSPLEMLWSIGGQREPALAWARALVESAAQDVEPAPAGPGQASNP